MLEQHIIKKKYKIRNKELEYYQIYTMEKVLDFKNIFAIEILITGSK